MKEKIELPISKFYVADWTVYHALREIFQNAIDREKESKFYSWSHSYDENLQRLSVTNKSTKLSVKTLLLGGSEKMTKVKMIGQFGEGYKLALIVLLRNKCNVVIENGNEIWMPKLEYSEKFDSEILTISIENQDVAGQEDLIFKIDLPVGMWKAYHQYNLHVQNGYKSNKTDQGEVLLDERHKKKIFVEGLFVCTLPEDFRFGYNFNAGEIELDRDRSTVKSWDVRWACGKMLDQMSRENPDEVMDMVRKSKADVYTYFSSNMTKDKKAMADMILDDFVKEHGEKAIPVVDEEEKKEVLSKFSDITTVIVKKTHKEAIESSSKYRELENKWEELPEQLTPHMIVEKFISDFAVMFESETEFTKRFKTDIYENSKMWVVENE